MRSEVIREAWDAAQAEDLPVRAGWAHGAVRMAGAFDAFAALAATLASAWQVHDLPAGGLGLAAGILAAIGLALASALLLWGRWAPRTALVVAATSATGFVPALLAVTTETPKLATMVLAGIVVLLLMAANLLPLALFWRELSQPDPTPALFEDGSTARR